MTAIGIWREKDERAKQHSVRVKYLDGNELEMPEDHYRDSKYLPHFDDLPWKDPNRS
jgi:hypothetical protein